MWDYIIFFFFFINMWDYIINIHPCDNLHFLLNNILTRLFKELKKNIRMTINNI